MYVRSSTRHHAVIARERSIDEQLGLVGRRVSSMKVYFCGSVRGGRDDVEIYLRIVTKLRSYATVLTEHVSKRELGDTGQTTPGTTQYTEYCQSPLYYTEEYSQY